MHFGLSSGLTDPTVINSQHSTSPQVFAMLGQRDGFAIDFVAKQMLINDAANPSNQYRGGPEQKLTKWGVSAECDRLDGAALFDDGR